MQKRLNMRAVITWLIAALPMGCVSSNPHIDSKPSFDPQPEDSVGDTSDKTVETPASKLEATPEVYRPVPKMTQPRNSVTFVGINGQPIEGNLLLTELVEGGLRIEGQLRKLEPQKKYIFQVHTRNDCTAGNNKSIGPRFNPDGAGPASETSEHLGAAGDLGKISTDASGNASVMLVANSLSLKQGKYNVTKRSFVLKESVDSTSGPTLVACGTLPGSY